MYTKQIIIIVNKLKINSLEGKYEQFNYNIILSSQVQGIVIMNFFIRYKPYFKYTKGLVSMMVYEIIKPYRSSLYGFFSCKRKKKGL